jgi:alkylation response protein AidB-like acyl-CoA dehydrogenase
MGTWTSVSEFQQKLTTVIERFETDATEVDLAQMLPRDHLDALAAIGLYGAFAPESDGGLGLSPADLFLVIEELAAACLASTFVWIQHLRLLAAVLDDTAPSLLQEMRSKVIRGEIKGGVALTGLLPGPSRLTAKKTAAGWLLDGTAPWVSGWGIVDELFVAARGPDETVVSLLVSPREQSGLGIARREMTAINGTSTIALEFQSFEVDNAHVVSHSAYDPLQESGVGLRPNGSLALGVTRRCCALIGESDLDDELIETRAYLDGADAETMPRARARASHLAMRAAGALSVHRGSSSVLQGDVAERTTREAALLLTFGSRPAIRSALLDFLTT